LYDKKDDHFTADTLERLLDTYSNIDGDGGDEVELLSIFKEDNWPVLFRLIERYVSTIKGRVNFDCLAMSVTAMNHLVTPSDIAFVLNTLDNNYDSWMQLAEAGGKMSMIPAGTRRIQPKYTKGRNHSVQLVESYIAMENKVIESLEAIDEPTLSRKFLDYIREAINEKNSKKEKNGKTKKKDTVPKLGKKRKWVDIAC